MLESKICKICTPCPRINLSLSHVITTGTKTKCNNGLRNKMISSSDFASNSIQICQKRSSIWPESHGGYCMICYSSISDSSDSYALNCRHTFCNECWSQYLTEKIRAGFQGINSNCMQDGCNMKVLHSTFEKFLTPSPKDKETYWKWLSKSFTDDNINIKWCPNV